MRSAYVSRTAGKRALRCYSERAACAQTARAPVVFARGRTPAHDASREGSDGTQARRAGRGGQLAGRGHPVRRRHHVQAAARRAHRRRRFSRHHAARSRPDRGAGRRSPRDVLRRGRHAGCASAGAGVVSLRLPDRSRRRRGADVPRQGGHGVGARGGRSVGRRGGTPAAAIGGLPPGDAVLDRALHRWGRAALPALPLPRPALDPWLLRGRRPVPRHRLRSLPPGRRSSAAAGVGGRSRNHPVRRRW